MTVFLSLSRELIHSQIRNFVIELSDNSLSARLHLPTPPPPRIFLVDFLVLAGMTILSGITTSLLCVIFKAFLCSLPQKCGPNFVKEFTVL